MDIHRKYMLKCINLAKKAGSSTYPNPLVGSVIVKNGKIIGKGYHKEFGKPHAEVDAINNSSESVENADLYVNLEPCSHYGKTPPCADLIIKKKIKNVYIGMLDPNPIVSGRGVTKLRESGINVVTGILEEKCKELNEVFTKLILNKSSFITLKIAATLDGKIAEDNGFSKWITSEKSRKLVHEFRKFSNGILIGANTLKKDNPFLNVRSNKKVLKEPYKIVVSKSLNFNGDYNVFKIPEKVVLVTSKENEDDKFNDFKKIILPEKDGLLDLTDLNKELFRLGIYNVLAEGGNFLSFYLLKYKCVDKIKFFYANKILGGNNSIGMIGGNESFTLKKSLNILIKHVNRIDNDLLVTGYPEYN